MFEIPALWSIEDYRQVFNRVPDSGVDGCCNALD